MITLFILTCYIRYRWKNYFFKYYNSILIIFTSRAFGGVPISLCFHNNCENSKYIIVKLSQHVIRKNVAPAHAQHYRVHSTYSVYEYQFFESEPKESIDYVLGSQRARIPSQEAEKPSRESGKPSQSSNGPGSLAANAHGLHFFYEYENEYILDKVSI